MDYDTVDTKCLHIKVPSKFHDKLTDKAARIGMRASTLARIIIQESIKDKSYLKIQVPEFLLPSQIVKRKKK